MFIYQKKILKNYLEKEKNSQPIKKLSQPGEFASKEKVEIINGKEKLNARVLGPLRNHSQAEISLTDAYNLKLNPLPKIRISGDIHGTTQSIS